MPRRKSFSNVESFCEDKNHDKMALRDFFMIPHKLISLKCLLTYFLSLRYSHVNEFSFLKNVSWTGRYFPRPFSVLLCMFDRVLPIILIAGISWDNTDLS